MFNKNLFRILRILRWLLHLAPILFILPSILQMQCRLGASVKEALFSLHFLNNSCLESDMIMAASDATLFK